MAPTRRIEPSSVSKEIEKQSLKTLRLLLRALSRKFSFPDQRISGATHPDHLDEKSSEASSLNFLKEKNVAVA